MVMSALSRMNALGFVAVLTRVLRQRATELAAFRPAERYDVVVLSNVLEHFLDPKAALADIARILRPGGELWISCPNARSWLRALCGRAWINWHVPFHIVHFTGPRLPAASPPWAAGHPACAGF